MLALAPPLQAHSPAHANLKVSAPPRSKTVPRRVQTSYTSTSTPTSSTTPSAPSSSVAAAPIVPASLSTHARTRSVAAQQQRHETHSAPEPSSSRQVPPPQPPQPAYLSVAATLERDAPSVATPTRPSSTTDVHTYPTTDLLRHLASLLNRIATANDSLAPPSSLDPSSSLAPHTTHIPDTPACRTLFTASRTALSTPTAPKAFHARNIPTISLEAYLLRILRYCPTTNEVFLSLLVYFDRMSKLSQEATGTRFAIDSYNVHRLVIAGVTVASKFFSDVFYTNSRYAKVGGLPQAELNQLELQFLLLNDFHLVIPAEEIQRYAEQLMGVSGGQNPPEGETVPSVGPSTTSCVVAPAPSRPQVSMGAFDAYGGAVSQNATALQEADAPRNGMATPRRTTSSVPPPSATPDDSFDRESSVYSETDTDAETDDEPTIRPAHSSGCSSETQSLYSNDTSEDAADDEDAEEEELRGRQPGHRWQNASVEGDRRMASP